MIGSTDFKLTSKILNAIKYVIKQYGSDITIVNSGELIGADPIIKKYTLHYELKFKCYNPSYTGYKMYSAEEMTYYGKRFHISHIFHRYKRLIETSDIIFIFGSPENFKHWSYIKSILSKLNKRYVIII